MTDRQELNRLRWAEMRLRDLADGLLSEHPPEDSTGPGPLLQRGRRDTARRILDILDASGPPTGLDAALADLHRAAAVLRGLLRDREPAH
jgi:hypothetical protein